MPVLANPRHERFAQELAKGKSQTDAYMSAGYDATAETARRAGSQLMANHDIAARLAELQGRAADKAILTAETILVELAEDRALARSLGQASAAVSASMGRAKVAGLIIEKREVGQPGEFDQMSSDELRDFLAREATALGVGDVSAALSGGPGAAGGKPH